MSSVPTGNRKNDETTLWLLLVLKTGIDYQPSLPAPGTCKTSSFSTISSFSKMFLTETTEFVGSVCGPDHFQAP